MSGDAQKGPRGRRCIHRAGSFDRCPKKAAKSQAYCHTCLAYLRICLDSTDRRSCDYVHLSVKSDTDAATLADGIPYTAKLTLEKIQEHKRLPKCASCSLHGKPLVVGGRFCSNRCAVKFAVAIAQTKRWDEKTDCWTRAEVLAVIDSRSETQGDP